jgi:hypothetical protein
MHLVKSKLLRKRDIKKHLHLEIKILLKWYIGHLELQILPFPDVQFEEASLLCWKKIFKNLRT